MKDVQTTMIVLYRSHSFHVTVADIQANDFRKIEAITCVAISLHLSIVLIFMLILIYLQ